MKVTIYNEHFYPSIGGVETFVYNLAKGLTDIGEEVEVITKTTDIDNHDDQYAFGIYRSPSKAELNRIIDNSDIVHINSFDPHLFILCKLKGKKIVYTLHDYTLICPKGTKFKLNRTCDHMADPVRCYMCLKNSDIRNPYRKLLRPFVKLMVLVLTDANVVGNTYSYKRLNFFNTRIINHGIDTDLFSPAPSSEAESDTITFIGRLIPEKGVDILLEAVGLCISRGIAINLSIVGIGPELEKIKKITRAKQISDHIFFHGALYGKKLVEIIRSSKIVVVPSVWDELFGLTAIEALSCGVPVVTSYVGGLIEIPDKASVKYSKYDSKNLAKIIASLMEDKQKLNSLSENGRKTVLENYNYLEMGKEYRKLYLKILRDSWNKNVFVNNISGLIPSELKRRIYVFMVDKGWPVRFRTGSRGIKKLGYRGYVGVDSIYDSAGRIQLEFMLKRGLKPEHILCDVGCGSLRGGKYFIEYLNPGNYLGLEGERELVELSFKNELDENSLSIKKPEFVFSYKFDFQKFTKSPDYALAISLFSHLNEEDILNCLSNLAKIIRDKCQFYASFNEAAAPTVNFRKSHSHLGFYYTIDQMKNFGIKTGWDFEYIGEWGSISGQKMAKYTIAGVKQ